MPHGSPAWGLGEAKDITDLQAGLKFRGDQGLLPDYSNNLGGGRVTIMILMSMNGF